MSNIESVAIWTGTVVAKVFATNIWLKSYTWLFAWMLWMIINGNEMLIFMIIILYMIDFVLWVISALYNRVFSSARFFMWATKLLVYWVFMVVWVSLWEALWLWNFFLSGIMAFCVITDSVSILENLEHLWFNTPMFLKKYLLAAQDNLEKKYMNNNGK